MRNASGQQGENEQNTYNISSTKRVIRNFLEVSRYSRAKQRQRNVHKKCATRAKLRFC